MGDKLSMGVKENFSDFSKFCKLCGKCCSEMHEGVVLIFPPDLAAIASFYHEPISVIKKKYCKSVEFEYDIVAIQDGLNFKRTSRCEYVPVLAINMAKTQNCPFFNANKKKCQIYIARPFQCQKFPLVECILTNPEMTAELAQNCFGLKKWLKNILSQDMKNENVRIALSTSILAELLNEERKLEFYYYNAIKMRRNRLMEVYRDYAENQKY